MPLHELLGELLTSLQQSRLLRRTPARNAVLCTEVSQSIVLEQVALLPRDTEINRMTPHPFYQILQPFGFHSLSELADSITSRKAKQLILSRRFAQRAYQGVFPSTFPNNHDAHGLSEERSAPTRKSKGRQSRPTNVNNRAKTSTHCTFFQSSSPRQQGSRATQCPGSISKRLRSCPMVSSYLG